MSAYGDDLRIFYPEVSIDDLIENKPLNSIRPQQIHRYLKQGKFKEIEKS